MEREFFKFDFSSSIFFNFKKFNIEEAWSSDNSQPLVNAPDLSFLPSFNSSLTPSGPILSNLSIDFKTLYCFCSSTLSSANKPWRIFLLDTFMVNWFLLSPQFKNESAIILHISASTWASFASPIISESNCVKDLKRALSAFSCLKTSP